MEPGDKLNEIEQRTKRVEELLARITSQFEALIQGRQQNVQEVLFSQVAYLGNIDVVRELIDVPMVAEVYFRLLECRDAVGDIVNICSCRGSALRDCVALLEAEMGDRMEIRINPEFVRAKVRRLVGSTAKLQSLIGAVTEIPVAATLGDVLSRA